VLYAIEPEVREFLAGLSPADLARTDFAAGLLATYGPELSEPLLPIPR
jgi:hypothetical protein